MRATIKRTSTDEANVSNRTVRFELYVDGAFVRDFQCPCDAADARDEINAPK